MLWTVARWPNGTWDTGGKPSDHDPECEVFQVEADSREKAKAKAQRIRAKQKEVEK